MRRAKAIKFMKEHPELNAMEIAEALGDNRKYITHIACVEGIKIASSKPTYVLTCCNGSEFILQCFKGMHDRVRDGKCPSIEWDRSQVGFEAFVKEIGSIPIGMDRPSVGRKDHSKGYECGNIMWEDFIINSGKHRGSKNESDFNELHAKRA